MHQYHLGSTEEEKDGELVVSKIFYQTQPRQCGNNPIITEEPYQKMMNINDGSGHNNNTSAPKTATLVDRYNAPYINYGNEHLSYNNLVVEADGSYIRYAMDAKKARVESNSGKSF